MAYTQYTLTQLQVLLAVRYEQNPFWTPEEAQLALNEGLKLWNLLVGQWHRTVTLESATDTYDYALPATMLYRTRVKWNGIRLWPTSLTALDRGRRGWMEETTTSGGGVPTRPTMWAPVSLQLIRIWPADAVAHNPVSVEGVSATPVLVAAGDHLDLGDELLDVLLGYGLHALSFKRGMPAIQATMPLFQAFLKAASEQNTMILASRLYRKWMGLDRQRQQQPLKVTAVPAGTLIYPGDQNP